MKVFLLNCFLMLAFLSLIGCSQNQKSVNLQVSASFSLGAAGFTGGLIAYGEGPNGAKFAVSSGTGQSVNTTIVDGTWKIYVMGWEDPNNFKFRGTKYCGMSEVNLASNDASVNITLSEANCESGTTFETDTAPKAVLISSCGGFYKYDSVNETYADPDSDSFCSSLPTALQGTFEYYRLALPTIQGSTVSPGIRTECIVAKGAGGPRLDIPAKKFPFRVMMFRSLQDCMNPTNPRMSAFGFLNGLEAGNQPSFDHHYYVSGGDARLFLPSSMTRRGSSPFINMLPRILCGGSDCFAQPGLPTITVSGISFPAQFNVPWSSGVSMPGNYDDNKDKTIIKGFRPTNVSSNTCDSPTLSLLNQNPNFSVEKCSIQNGDLRGNFVRNGLVCRNNNTEFGSVSDLYERNGRIYQYDSSVHKIRVYSEKGVYLSTVALAAAQTYKSMATDSANNLYVAVTEANAGGGTYSKLLKYNFSNGNYNASDVWSSDTYSHLSNIEKIEVTDNGKIVAATTSSIHAFDITNMSTSGTAVSITGSSPSIKKILFRNSKLYILTFESSYPELYAATLSGLTLSSLGTSYFNGTGSSDPEYASFHYTEIAGIKYFVFNPKDTVSDLQIYPITNLTAPSHTIAYNSVGSGDIPSGGSIIMVKNIIYKKSAAGFTARNFIPAMNGASATANVVGSTAGLCSTQLTQAATPNSDAYYLNLRSASGNTYDTIFDDAFRFIGRRVVPLENFYYFKSLAESDKDNGFNPGGILGRVEQMLGPDGIGGVLNGLYPGQDCAAIRNDVVPSTGSVTKTATLYDIIDGSTQTVSINLSKPGTGVGMMGTFACGGAGTTTDCAADLVLDVGMVGKSEKMRLKLDCDAKRGSIENREYKVSDSENRHLILWNIDSSNAQYEEYTLEDRVESSELKTNASVTRLVKKPGGSTGSYKIEMRQLEIDRNNSTENIEGRANEFYRSDYSGDKFMSTAVKTGFISLNDWETDTNSLIGTDNINSVTTSSDIRSITTSPTADLHHYAGICMSSGNSTLAYMTAQSCSVPTTHIISSPSMKAAVTTLKDLHDYTSDTNGAMASEFATDVFELTP